MRISGIEQQFENAGVIFGSWSIPDEVVARLTQLGIYAMQMGEDTMELVSASELEG